MIVLCCVQIKYYSVLIVFSINVVPDCTMVKDIDSIIITHGQNGRSLPYTHMAIGLIPSSYCYIMWLTPSKGTTFKICQLRGRATLPLVTGESSVSWYARSTMGDCLAAGTIRWNCLTFLSLRLNIHEVFWFNNYSWIKHHCACNHGTITFHVRWSEYKKLTS